MGARQEAIIREFCEAWGDGDQRAPDLDKLASMFAEDARWVLYMPGGPVIQGRPAIRAELDRQMTYIDKTRCNIRAITSGANTVMTERADTFLKRGRKVTLHVASIYDLDGDGKITGWREYVDTMDLAKQAQDDPARISGLETA